LLLDPVTLNTEVVGLLGSRMDASNGLWSVYITVVFAVFGFMISARKVIEWPHAVLIAVVFGAFALTNWVGLDALCEQRNALYQYFSIDKLGSHPDVFRPLTVLQMTIMHVVCDVLVIAGILFLGLPRRHKKPGSR